MLKLECPEKLICKRDTLTHPRLLNWPKSPHRLGLMAGWLMKHGFNWFMGRFGRATYNQFLSRTARKESKLRSYCSNVYTLVLIIKRKYPASWLKISVRCFQTEWVQYFSYFCLLSVTAFVKKSWALLLK